MKPAPVYIDKPVAGVYRMRRVSNGPWCAIEIWFGPPPDPENEGQWLDRSHRWLATMDGLYVAIDTVWPWCSDERITEEEYAFIMNMTRFARRYAPERPEADKTKPIDVNKLKPVF